MFAKEFIVYPFVVGTVRTESCAGIPNPL